MSQPVSVKVSSRYQIAVPSQARERLNIQRGDRLLVDIHDGLILLIPMPKSFSTQFAGLHREIWSQSDTAKYVNEEREDWNPAVGK